MTKHIFLFVATTFLFWGVNCKKDIVAPIDEIKSGRRDYVWYVDTINAGGNFIQNIDGISPNDVWAISSPGDFTKIFYHFDGNECSTDNIYRAFIPSQLRAFSTSNVWCVGSQGYIWKYNGIQWEAITQVTADSASYWSLEGIDGYSPTNFYATGLRQYQGQELHPLVYHFLNNTWTRVNVEDVVCSLTKISFYAPSKALVSGLKNQTSNNDIDTNKIFMFNGIDLKEIYTAPDVFGKTGNFFPVSNGIIILKGRKLIFFNGSSEENLFDIQDSKAGGIIGARNKKDVIIPMLDGIAHYNGIDFQYIYHFSNSGGNIFFIKLFPDCVFVSTFDWNKRINVIYRGYLK